MGRGALFRNTQDRPEGGESGYGQGNCANVNDVMLRQANTMAQMRIRRVRAALCELVMVGRWSVLRDKDGRFNEGLPQSVSPA